jgi:hypothetical protein
LTENPIVIDDEDGDPIDLDPGLGSENTDGDAGGAAQMGEVVANSELDDASISQDDDRSAIAISASFSPEIPESDSGAMLDEEGQLHPPVQGDSIASSYGKRSRGLSGSDRPDGRGSDWVFDVFAEDDGGTEGDGSPASKRARSSPHPSEVTENKPSPAALVAGKDAQMPSSAHGDRSPRDDQRYEVHQVVGESGSEYEVTVLTKMWLPKTSVGLKLVRKFRAEQRATTRGRTRRSSRLQNRG